MNVYLCCVIHWDHLETVVETRRRWIYKFIIATQEMIRVDCCQWMVSDEQFDLITTDKTFFSLFFVVWQERLSTCLLCNKYRLDFFMELYTRIVYPWPCLNRTVCVVYCTFAHTYYYGANSISDLLGFCL